LPIPAHWTRSIQSALLHVIALAQYALVYSNGWAADSSNQRVRLRAKADQLEQQISLLGEEIRIKDARMALIPPTRRPHFPPAERLAILELRAARGWSLAQTAKVFQVTAATIASWAKRLDEEGPDALLCTQEPVNKFPDFVGYMVQRLRRLCPRLGKVQIAQVLTRAGLHLSATTIGRLGRQPTTPPPTPRGEPMPSAQRLHANRPNHVWHIDLTTVPTSSGFWVPWRFCALPQCWPFCWWLAVVLDHYSRRVLGMTIFKQQPTSHQVQQFLGRVIAKVGAAPKYLITDSGTQFTAAEFKSWCRRHGIRHRRGAIGMSGSIAVIERFICTLKSSCTRLLPVVPLLHRSFQRELQLFGQWYNADRPHGTLQGATPDEVYFRHRPACRSPRFEPRAAWPRGSPCAQPQALVKGQPGVRLELTVDFVAQRRCLKLLVAFQPPRSRCATLCSLMEKSHLSADSSEQTPVQKSVDRDSKAEVRLRSLEKFDVLTILRYRSNVR
jgi:transposase InsO family protein